MIDVNILNDYFYFFLFLVLHIIIYNDIFNALRRYTMFQTTLKILREKRGISQAKLAQDLGVAQSTVGMWENGKNKPEYDTLLNIAKYFNVSVDYLISENESSALPYDPDTAAAMEEAFDRPEMRALFSVSKNATREDIEKTIAIIKTLKGDDDFAE